MGQEADHSLGEVLRPGTVLRDYEIGRVLGRGGFGVVYQGHHLELGSRVAIKEFFRQRWPVGLEARFSRADRITRARMRTDCAGL